MELPMFPLGTVLFPSIVLPLHVFEPRYRTMTRDVLDGGGEFGVVLIERGSEVGGHDVRTDVGTVARVVEAVELEDGRWVLGTVGTRRVRVRRWLPDDPYPRADVEDFDDDTGDGGIDAADVGAAYTDVRQVLRRVLAIKVELGQPAVAATIELSDDPALGSFQVAAVSPIGPLDQQRVLAAPTAGARLALLRGLLDAEASFLEKQIG
jgi:Lon protease-like protein